MGESCWVDIKSYSTLIEFKLTIFAPLYRSFFVNEKHLGKKWPQFDLYFLSKPEVTKVDTKISSLKKMHISTVFVKLGLAGSKCLHYS